MWPRIRPHLPAPPAVVVELGCGSHGGFVPALQHAGYQALGVDPQAPEGDAYRRVEFERTELPAPIHAVVASASLHHVADPAVVLDRMAEALAPGGAVVVVEWDWQSFDEPSARWCFERMDSEQAGGWLQRTRENWLASGLGWEAYLSAWAAEHGMHGVPSLVRELDRRFDRLSCERGAFFFADLPHTTEADELRAIDAGEIRPLRIDYVARRR